MTENRIIKKMKKKISLNYDAGENAGNNKLLNRWSKRDCLVELFTITSKILKTHNVKVGNIGETMMLEKIEKEVETRYSQWWHKIQSVVIQVWMFKNSEIHKPSFKMSIGFQSIGINWTIE